MYLVLRSFDDHVQDDWLNVPRTDRTVAMEKLGLIRWMQTEITEVLAEPAPKKATRGKADPVPK
jgi:hypothetical protein